jgi:hypothetical protein
MHDDTHRLAKHAVGLEVAHDFFFMRVFQLWYFNNKLARNLRWCCVFRFVKENTTKGSPTHIPSTRIYARVTLPGGRSDLARVKFGCGLRFASNSIFPLVSGYFPKPSVGGDGGAYAVLEL